MDDKSPEKTKSPTRRFFSSLRHGFNRQPSESGDDTLLSVPGSSSPSMHRKAPSSSSWKEFRNPFHRSTSPVPTRPTTPTPAIPQRSQTEPQAEPAVSFPEPDISGQSTGVSSPTQVHLELNHSPPPPQSKSALRVTWNFTKTLLTYIGEFAELDPLKMAFGLVKMTVDIADNVKENMDVIERRVYSITVQLDAVQQALDTWSGSGQAEKRAVERFNTALGDEFRKLKQLSNEWLITKIADCENEKAEIAVIFERVNEARVQLGVEADLRTLRMAHAIDKHVRESLLDRLKPSDMADHTYELEGSQKDKLRRVICTHGTRVALQEEIIAWAKQGSELVYWLSGPAGSGKSTVAYTLARRFELAAANDPVVLGANFFCSRHYEETRFATRIIRTISYQLALRFKPFADALIEVGEFSSATKSVQDQLKHLLVIPWQRVLKSRSSTHEEPRHLIIIDALDELDSTGGTDFLRIVLPALAKDSLHGLRFLVTSRPNPELAQQLTKFDGAKAFRLQDIAPEEARADVEVYLNESLPQLVGKPQLKRLVILTDGLFVYAATIVNHLLPRRPLEQIRFLEHLFALDTPTSPSTHGSSFRQATRLLDQLYFQLLIEAFKNFEPDSVEYLERLTSLHTFLCVNEPVSMATAASLLFEDEYTNTDPTLSSTSIVEDVVGVLHAVLYVQNGKVLSYHKSFADFIFDEARSSQFWCNPPIRHRQLAEASFRIMGVGLRFNIANIPSSYLLDSNNPDLPGQIRRNIPPSLRYACHHWTYHLSSLPPPLSPSNPDPLCNALQDFLLLPALFWIEAMNLLGSRNLCDSMFQSAYNFLSQYGLAWAVQYLEASNFAIYFTGSPTSLSTPHLYLSSLATWPRDASPVAEWKTHFPNVPRFTNPHRGGMCLSAFKTNSPVYSVQFSHDGSKVVSGTADKLVRVMDSSTGKVLQTLEGHKDEVWSVAYSNDDTRIASGSKDEIIRIWDAKTGHLSSTLTGHTHVVTSVAFSPDGSRLVSGSHDEQAFVWDLDTGDVEHVLDEHSNSVMAVTYSPDGRYIVTGSWDEDVFLWNPKDGEVLKRLVGHDDKVCCVAVSCDSTRVASGSRSGRGKIWDPSTGKCLVNLIGSAMISAIAFVPNEQQIVTSTFDALLRLWDTCTGNVLRVFDGHTSLVRCVAVSPNGRRFVSGSKDKTVRVWDASMTEEMPDVIGHSMWVRGLVVSQDGKQIISTSLDKTIQTWDSTTGSLIKKMEGSGGGYWSITMTKDGSRIITGSHDGPVHIWDAAAGEVIGELEGHERPIRAVAISDDGGRVFSASDDGSVRVWDAGTRQLLMTFDDHHEEVTSLCVWPNGTKVVSASEDSTLKIWDALEDDAAAAVLTLRGHDGPVNGVALSGDGSRIVSASNDKSLRLWDGVTGDLIRVINGHTNEVHCVDISHDGTRIVSGSRDETVRVWDADTGDALNVMDGHISVVLSVKFFDNATRVVSCGRDKTVRVWDLSSTTSSSPYTLDLLEGSVPTGWLLSPGGEGYLMFISPDVRLPHSSNLLTLPSYSVSSVDLSGASLGQRWSSCYLSRAP